MKTIISVQYLRAIAALVVAYHHIFENRNAAELAQYAFGVWGVDVFFVISGFIMWVTTAGGGSNTILFWKNRAIRIYPIYWIALTLWIVVRLKIPDRLANADVDGLRVIFSYLLIPHYHRVFISHVWPILVPGWTLQYEVFFYFIFGLMLLSTNRAVRAPLVCGILICLGVAGAVLNPHNAFLVIYTSPLLLEFGAGVLLGCAYLNKILLPAWAAPVAVILGFVGLFTGESLANTDLSRLLASGVPAFLVVAGSVSLESKIALSPSRALVSLGNASYSIYLFHPFAIGMIAVFWEKFLPKIPEFAFVITALLGTAIVGQIVHNFIEDPLIHLLKRPACSSSVR